MHGRAVPLDGPDLGDGGTRGHVDLAGKALDSCRVREGLGVIPGAGGDDAADLARAAHLVQGAAHLERAGALEVLGLQDDVPAHAPGDRPGAQHGGLAHDLGARCMGGAQAIERELLDLRDALGRHPYRESATIASISTRTPFGSAATPTAARAGGSDSKNAAYASLISAKASRLVV